jgi:hypothetical protein
VPVLAADAAQRVQRFRPLDQRLADADQDARRERHADAPGVFEHP